VTTAVATRAAPRSRSWLSTRALSVAVLGAYAVMQIGAAIVGWVEFVAEQQSHGTPAQVLGPDGYIWTLLEQTLQNWQSEFLALAALVVLTSVFVHRDSKHSKEGQEEVQKRVQAIQRRVERLAAGPAGQES